MDGIQPPSEDLFDSLDDIEGLIDFSTDEFIGTEKKSSWCDDSISSFNYYLREIGSYSLLDNDQEFWAGVKILAENIFKRLGGGSSKKRQNVFETIIPIYKLASGAWGKIKGLSTEKRNRSPNIYKIVIESIKIKKDLFSEECSYLRTFITENNLSENKCNEEINTTSVDILACFLLLPEEILEWISNSLHENQFVFPDEKEFQRRFKEKIFIDWDPEEIYNQAEEARQILTLSNLRLVISIARHYQGRNIPIEDLVQEGNLGLIKAIEKFNPAKGFKFSTYSTWWIRQSITRYIAEYSRLIRIPVHKYEALGRLQKFRSNLIQTYGREPTLEELALESGYLSDDDVVAIKQSMKDNSKVAYDIHRRLSSICLWIQKTLQQSEEPISLDYLLRDGSNTQIGDLIQDENAPDPDQESFYLDLVNSINDALIALSSREQQVLELRYGLLDGEAKTLEEVSKEFGVTRERIRQIEFKALQKLRHPARSRNLRSFL